ncbi:MAG: hypothetical protein AAF725_06675 [Acidobacteriota bacterium]
MEASPATASNPFAPAGAAADAESDSARNPYAPPSADLSASPIPGQHAESIRRELLSHEASIRSIGTLYYISVFFLSIAALVLVVGSVSAAEPVMAGLGLFFGFIAWVHYYMASGLRSLRVQVRTLVSFFAVIGLTGFPIGTLINAYILWLLHGEKGKRVLSQEYLDVVAMTPHIRYKTPLWVWIFLGLLVALIGFVGLSAYLSP